MRLVGWYRGDGRHHARAIVGVVKLIHRPCRRILIVKEDCDVRFVDSAYQERVAILVVPVEEDMPVLIELSQRIIGNDERDGFRPEVILCPGNRAPTRKIVVGGWNGGKICVPAMYPDRIIAVRIVNRQGG